MLDATYRKHSVFAGGDNRFPEPWRDGIDFGMFLAKVHQQKRTIVRLMLVGALLGCFAGIFYNLLRVTTFTGSSELLISNTTLQMSGPDAVVTQVLVENTLIQSAMEMLMSSNVLGRVVDKVARD